MRDAHAALQADSNQKLDAEHEHAAEGGPKNPATAALEAAKAVNAGLPVDEVAAEGPKA